MEISSLPGDLFSLKLSKIISHSSNDIFPSHDCFSFSGNFGISRLFKKFSINISLSAVMDVDWYFQIPI